MTSLAPPGALVSTGRLRVDAARAVAKLREYQLADRAAWVLEAVRAAVASGARAIWVDGDANDVRVRWEGEPWPDAVLSTLFDELVSPEPARDAQHLRLLGTAVNSALGGEPAYVDVIANHPTRAARVRYRPEVLDLPVGDETPALRRLAVDAIDPEGPSGMLIHLRRPAGAEVLGNFLRGEPPELARVRDACRDVGVPVAVDGHRLARPDLLRQPLGEGLTGFVAITPLGPHTPLHAELQVAERGVVIATYPLELGTLTPTAAVAMPVRVFVDAPRMPTNASRSDVRFDAHPLAATLARAPAAYADLLGRLAATLADERMTTEPLRAAALAILGAATATPDWAHKLRDDELPAPYRALAELSLVRDALGRPRRPRDPWSLTAVHTGDAPFDEALAPWLQYVLWVPDGDPASALIRGAAIDRKAVRAMARGARRRLRAQARFERFARRGATLPPGDRLITVPLERDWLHGEVGVRATGGATLTVLYDGRELAIVDMVSAVAFDAIVDTLFLTPLENYRGIEHDGRFLRVVGEVRDAVTRAVEQLARGTPAPAAHPVLRRAFQLGRVDPASPLLTARCWPTRDGRVLSLEELGRLPVIGVMPTGAPIDTPADRTVVLTNADERELLAGVLEPMTKVVPYTRAVLPVRDRASDLATWLLRDYDVVALAVRGERARGAIAWGVSYSRVHLGHGGVVLAESPYQARLVPAAIALDDDAVIPDPEWRAVRDVAGAFERDLGAWEIAMARAVAAAVLGDEVPDLSPGKRPLALRSPGGLALCGALALRDPDELLGAELAARLRAYPLWPVLNSLEARSADALAKAHASIPVLRERPSYAVDTGDWLPAIASEVEAAALGKLAARPTHLAIAELATRQRAAIRARNIALHRMRPELPLAIPGAAISVELHAAGLRGVVGVGRDNPGVRVDLRVDNRHFQYVEAVSPLALEAVLEVGKHEIDPEHASVLPAAVARAIDEVHDRAGPLLAAIAKQQPTWLDDDQDVRQLLIAWLAHVEGQRKHDTVRHTLREAVAFTTVQDGRASVAQASLYGQVRLGTWMGQWLDAGGGEVSPLDQSVLHVAEGAAGLEKRALLTTLAQKQESVDLTADVRKLQTTRRMERGTILTPTVSGVSDRWKRPLRALGDAGRGFGPGEIALVAESGSRLLVHDGGEPRGEVLVDVLPPVRIAVEAPDLADELDRLGRLDGATRDAVTRRAQDCAAAMVRELVGGERPEWLTRGLRRARLGGKLRAKEIEGVPLFETTAGTRVTWDALTEQHERFGNVWYTDEQSRSLPLDPNRIVLRLDDPDSATGCGLRIVDATSDLALDERARANQAQPPAESLALTPGERRGALVVAELVGDGISGPRGTIAVLASGAEGQRGVRVHRAMLPLGVMPDPCEWPTAAVIDDARLHPDRSWSAPADDGIWKGVQVTIREASERALGALAPPPDGALAHRGLTASSGCVPKGLAAEGVRARGRLWLDAGIEPMPIAVTIDRGTVRQVLPSVPVRGVLLVLVPWHLDLATVIDELCRDAYPELVRAAARERGAQPPVIAHLVLALDDGWLKEDAVRRLGPAGHAALEKRRRPAPAPAPAPAPEPHPAPVSTRAIQPPERRDLLGDLVRERLVDLGLGAHVRAVARHDHFAGIAYHEDGMVWLGAAAQALRPHLDVLVAHVVTVLNEDLTEVTDATESHAIGRLLERHA